MLTLRQFRYGSDNLGYVIHGSRHAVAVDGGAVQDILSYLAARDLSLLFVTNTHDHPDHTPGNSLLLKRSGATYLSPPDAANAGSFFIEEEPIHVISTPGHTVDSVVFHSKDRILTGDTLFNGTVGNCFSGNVKAFHESLIRLMALPDGTRVYAGHDYAADAIAFARSLEPGNPHIARYLSQYQPDDVYSTLSDERLVNPYLRFNDPAMIRLLEQRGLPVSTEFERFESIMMLG